MIKATALWALGKLGSIRDASSGDILRITSWIAKGLDLLTTYFKPSKMIALMPNHIPYRGPAALGRNEEDGGEEKTHDFAPKVSDPGERHVEYPVGAGDIHPLHQR
jgi:hypothetical protein